MPYKSEKQETLEELETFVLAEHIVDLIFDDDSDDDDDEEKNDSLFDWDLYDLDDLDAKIDAIIEGAYDINALLDDDNDEEEDDFDTGIIDGLSIAETMYLLLSSTHSTTEQERHPVINDHCRRPILSYTTEDAQTQTPSFSPPTSRKRKLDAVE